MTSQVVNSTLNSSVSKQKWSFPKGPRFLNSSQLNCAKPFYDLPPIREKRTASMGYGNRLDFSKSVENIPSPDSYNLPSEFSLEKSKKHGIGFGCGREKWAAQVVQIGKDSPGPGVYDVKALKSSLQFTLKSRINSTQNLLSALIPGPGAYNLPPTINDKGKIFESKFKSSLATTISPAKGQRFYKSEQSKQIPGPGQYSPKLGIDPKGQYFQANIHNTNSYSFSHAERQTLQLQKNVPGPGQYQMPSDFGYVDTSKLKTQSLIQLKNKNESETENSRIKTDRH